MRRGGEAQTILTCTLLLARISITTVFDGGLTDFLERLYGIIEMVRRSPESEEFGMQIDSSSRGVNCSKLAEGTVTLERYCLCGRFYHGIEFAALMQYHIAIHAKARTFSCKVGSWSEL